jgi:hypothetical protein
MMQSQFQQWCRERNLVNPTIMRLLRNLADQGCGILDMEQFFQIFSFRGIISHPMIIIPDIPNIVIEDVSVADAITLAVRTTSPTACCPSCGAMSERVQSRYMRTLYDLPASGRLVTLHVQVRRFFCPQRSCPRKIFAEPLPELKAAGVLPHYVELRQVKYRGNLIEQDHRLLKRLRHPRDGLFLLGDSLANRYRGFEGMNRRRKGQLQGVEKGDVRGQIALIAKLFAVAVSERLRGKTPCSLCVLRIFLQHNLGVSPLLSRDRFDCC